MYPYIAVDIYVDWTDLPTLNDVMPDLNYPRQISEFLPSPCRAVIIISFSIHAAKLNNSVSAVCVALRIQGIQTTHSINGRPDAQDKHPLLSCPTIALYSSIDQVSPSSDRNP